MLFMCMNFSSRGLKEAVVNSYYSDACAHFDSLNRHFVARTICPFKVPWIASRNERLPVVNLTETLRNNLLCKAKVAICSCCIIPHFARRIYALSFSNNSHYSYWYSSLFYAVSHLSHSIFSTCLQIMRWNFGSSNPGRRRKFFSSPIRPDRDWGPPTILFCGYWGSFPGAKRPGREVGHWTPSCAKVELHLYSPYLPTWRGQENFTFQYQSVQFLFSRKHCVSITKTNSLVLFWGNNRCLCVS